jgi:HTH-type transcriptional regulator/antitoxin HigA
LLSEQKANDFAAEILIPKRYDTEIEAFTTETELYKLADALKIAPGIVAGRHQHLKGNFKKFNRLKCTLEWTENE